jgi:hypothetical protein
VFRLFRNKAGLYKFEASVINMVSRAINKYIYIYPTEKQRQANGENQTNNMIHKFLSLFSNIKQTKCRKMHSENRLSRIESWEFFGIGWGSMMLSGGDCVAAIIEWSMKVEHFRMKHFVKKCTARQEPCYWHLARHKSHMTINEGVSGSHWIGGGGDHKAGLGALEK